MDNDSRLEYPEGKVAGILNASDVDAATAALRQAGFAADRIDVITAADVEDVETPLEKGGFPGLIERFLLSIGDHIHELELIRQDLEAGLTLVTVTVDDDDAKYRAAGILHEHGSRGMKFFGRWSVQTLAGPH